ncbi:hypothetical protein CRM22_000643 [Opisthorchis felineus]|uniref:Phosphorylase b kinase regulatory subunit n=2 Tax=Opisthorchiidae TaxID=6196 RepID=A0A4S2MK98_OPIFE|nr:hypothetical protein CRM22_000643 [Opisthorchis felineus]
MDKKKLDYFYDLLNSTILCHQNTITGLIPSCPSSSHAWVRDNTYASLSIWGLALAYRKLPDVDEDRSRSYELEKCVVKLMRGILVCYMKQADKVETLKKFEDPKHSLHAKFDANTCKTVVGDNEWGHLQIDAVSVYLLTLAQMTASGIRIIWTTEEVAFIQNLVFYIEHAYRIPDYGIWERGDKTNHGLPELNTTSVGMAKAALEAMTDLDLFGADGSPLSTIHVFPDETQQCNTVLESVLPRESNSKETDAGLLCIITYPGFAITDEQLSKQTRDTIVQKLLGRYGCRRFIRDGFRTAREDPNRQYYEPWELRMFEGIECEWPMFLAWLLLDATFREDYDDADRYLQMLQDVVVRESVVACEGFNAWEKPMCRRTSEVTSLSNYMTNVLMPETYAVPVDRIDAELANPHSQDRDVKGALPHIWGQSLYILAHIIYEGLLLPGEIDPLGRRLLTQPKPDLSVQVVLVAEDDSMKCTLLDDQIDAQTFAEIYNEAGIHIYPAKVLSQLYKQLGVCDKLVLGGRSNKEVGVLSTSQFYRLTDQTVAFIPQIFDHHAFYLNLDINFILDCFRTCVAFLKRAWTSPGRPLLIFPIYHRFFRSTHSKQIPPTLLATIKKMATGYLNGTKVILGSLKTFEETSSLKQLNFLGSADSIFQPCDLSSVSPQRRRLTPTSRLEGLDRVLLEEGTGNLSPTSGSSAGMNYDQDSFQRFSMRRKSMALARAVNLDLINRERDDFISDDVTQDLSWPDTEVESVVESAGSHFLRQKTETEDLTCSASRLALKRMLNPETNTREQQSVQQSSQTSAHLSPTHAPSRSLSTNSPGEIVTPRTLSAEHSRRTSEVSGSSPDWLVSLTPEQLAERLTHTYNLAEQVEILGRLRQLRGLDWDTGIDPTQAATVRMLLKEAYERASQLTSWFLLRYTAGLLGKRASTLAKSLTDILVRQKQVTIGLPPEPREIIIDAPLPPDQLAELIQKACGEDALMNVLTQELLTYLSMVARTKPQLLNNISRLRIGLIIQMMAAELARTMCVSAEDSLYGLFCMSPFDTKRLLLNLLSGEEIRMVKTVRNVRRKSTMKTSGNTPVDQMKAAQALAARRMSVNPRTLLAAVPSLTRVSAIEETREFRGTEMRNLWSRRRKIDGALNRVPPGFYERVYIVLSRVESLIIGGHVLSNSLTREMTMGEHKFALAVERVSTMVSTPEFRQLLIEATHVLGTLMMHDIKKRVQLDCAIKVDEIVDVANVLFLLDQVKYDANATLCCAKVLKEQNITEVSKALAARQPGPLACHGLHNVCQHFYDTPPAGRFGTMSYMVRAVAYLLQSVGPLREDGLLSVDCSVQ